METKKCNRCGVVRDVSQWHPSALEKSGRWCKPCMRAYYRAKNKPEGVTDDPRPCVRCGTTYAPKAQRSSVYCSCACKDAARNERRSAATVAAKPARACVQCGADMRQSMRADAKFCSADCNASAHQLGRKFRNRRVGIADRDNWVCGICHGPIAWGLGYPNPECLSLDHVLPVSRGGSSEPENLQAAHWICNVRRRDSLLISSEAVA